MSNGRWFRFYDDTINNPKALKLSDKTFRIWVGMLCLASKNDGVLPSFEDMVIMLRVKADKLQPELEKLIEAELLEHSDIGITPHNWSTRQYKSDVSTDRVKRFRNGKRNVSETPPETEADTEQKDAEPDGSQSDEADLFRRGKSVLGSDAGGLIAKLLKSKNKSVPLARAALEHAATKQNPREYIGRVVSGKAATNLTGIELPEGTI